MSGLHYLALYDLYRELEFVDREPYVKSLYIPEMYDIYLEDHQSQMSDLISFGSVIGDTDKIKKMINLRIDPSEIDEYRRTILMRLIVEFGDNKIDIIDRFISTYGTKCSPSAVDIDGDTALMFSCHFHNRAKIANLLLDKFGNMCNPSAINDDGESVMTLAINRCYWKLCVRLISMFGMTCSRGLLIEMINSSDENYESIKEMIDTLGNHLQPGLVIDDTTSDGGDTTRGRTTALIKACETKNQKVAKKLIKTFGENCNPRYKRSDGSCAFSIAKKRRLRWVLEVMRSKKYKHLFEEN